MTTRTHGHSGVYAPTLRLGVGRCGVFLQPTSACRPCGQAKCGRMAALSPPMPFRFSRRVPWPDKWMRRDERLPCIVPANHTPFLLILSSVDGNLRVRKGSLVKEPYDLHSGKAKTEAWLSDHQRLNNFAIGLIA